MFSLVGVHITVLKGLTIDLHFLIPANTAQILNPIGELVIPIGIRSKEAKGEVEINSVILKAKKI